MPEPVAYLRERCAERMDAAQLEVGGGGSEGVESTPAARAPAREREVTDLVALAELGPECLDAHGYPAARREDLARNYVKKAQGRRCYSRQYAHRLVGWDGAGLLIAGEQVEILGGQERVLESLLERYPAADAVALSFASDPSSVGRSPVGAERVRRLRVPGKRRPLLMPLYAGRMALASSRAAEVVLSLTQGGSSVAARTRGATRHVAYSSGPPTLYGQSRLSLADERPVLRPLVRAALPALRACHGRLMRRPDRLIANSSYSASHLRSEYGLAAEVLHPPVRAGFFTPRPSERRHWLAVGRVTSQKRFDLVVEAFAQVDAPLVVAGVGAALDRLRAAAPPNVTFVGFAGDESLRELYRSARGLICPSVETFGLVMAEALACGTPVIAPRVGGALELVREGVNGVFLEDLDAGAVLRALGELERLAPSPQTCRASIEAYSDEHFLAQMEAILDAERALARAPSGWTVQT
jgi:glycosyltransferase involved in cell wall biosynthesis